MRFRYLACSVLPVLVAAAACKSSDPARETPSTATAAGTPAAGGDSAFVAAADLGRIQGAESAPVWLLVISDFQCPYCRMWHEETYPAVYNEYVRPGRVRIAYINLPLSSHPHAVPAAEAAMCAGAQGKFWEVADGIFDTQERWTPMADAGAVYDSIATAAGVNVAEWRDCVTQDRTLAMIQADASRASGIGVQSTPSFVVMRGSEVVRGIAGAYPIATFRETLDSALARPGRPQQR